MKVLFICTHNRCRSILSEAIMNHMASDTFEARSAGSQPSAEVHPLSLKFLAEIGIPTQGLKSQSWNEFESWQPDIIITVCDSAAGETCPIWFGNAVKIHWGLKDPSKITASDSEITNAFRRAISEIASRTRQLANLGLESMPKEIRQQELERVIGNDNND